MDHRTIAFGGAGTPTICARLFPDLVVLRLFTVHVVARLDHCFAFPGSVALHDLFGLDLHILLLELKQVVPAISNGLLFSGDDDAVGLAVPLFRQLDVDLAVVQYLSADDQVLDLAIDVDILADIGLKDMKIAVKNNGPLPGFHVMF